MLCFRAIRVLAAVMLSLLPVIASNAVPVTGRIDPVDAKNIMLVKDVKRGMKGYGKTVFRGTTIETFGVEVLGVMSRVNAGTDLVIVRLSGGPITSRGANLIEGMSGSPVYINGKILGAFAYGQVFGKEPIGMVTPIENMLEAWDPSLPAKPSSFYPFSTASLDQPIALGGRYFQKVAISSGDDVESFDPGTMIFRPLATPIMVSGMSSRTMARLQESLSGLNARLISGPGAPADKQGLKVDLQPGSAIGVQLVTGDLDMTGIGTLTYRRGNRILAFGHPMFGIGAIDAVLCSAYVYDIFPSFMVSNKLAGPLESVGRIYQDRPWCVAGEIGKKPKMIPVVVHVSTDMPGKKKDFKVEVVNHPLVINAFLPAAVSEAVFRVTGAPSDTTAKVKLLVDAEEVGAITRENTFFDPVAIDTAAVSELQQILSMLHFNPFHPVGLKKVEVWVELAQKHQTAKLERIFVKEAKVEPGDTVEIGAVLKPYKGDSVLKTIKLKIPKNAPNGRMSLTVSGGMLSRAQMPQQEDSTIGGIPGMGPGGPGMPSAPGIENLQQLVKKFLERGRNDELTAKIVLPNTAPMVGGEKLSGLPPSIAEAMKSTKATTISTEREEIKATLPTDWVVLGVQRLTITVERRDKSEKKSPARSEPEPSVDESSSAEEGTTTEEGGSPDESGGEEGVYLSLDTWTTIGSDVTLPETTAAPASESARSEEKADTQGEETDKQKTEPSTPPAVDEKPVGRQPVTWKQTTRTEFLGGTCHSVAATTGDLITLAGTLKPLYESAETYVWCVLPDGKGGVYMGTGNNGVILRVTPDGKSSVVYDSPELEIHSLAMDAAGNLLAGTSPNGIVYRIGADGKASVLLDADEKYIVALASDSKGNIYAATGDKCKVYKISSDGKVSVVLDTSESHALSLAVDKADNLYVGTGLNGIIYKVSPAGNISVLYDAAETSVTALAVKSDGTLYAGTAPKGVIYRLSPGETPKVVYNKSIKPIQSLCVAGGNVYVATSDTVFEVAPDDTIWALENDRDLQFLSLAAAGGKLFVGTGNTGDLYCAEIGNQAEGTYESVIHDCGSVSTWGVIDWNAEGGPVILQTRTGNVAEPDSTWSDWSAPYTAAGNKITSPPGRYVQYRAILKAGASGETPKLKDVSIVYLPRNQAPKVTLISPKGGEKWARKKTIKWTGSDPDKDTLSYELSYSTDGGKTWQPLGDKIKTAPSRQSEPKTENGNNENPKGNDRNEAIKIDSTDPESMMAEMRAELDKHPEIPQEVKDKIIAEAPAMMQQTSEESSTEETQETDSQESTPDSTKQTSFSWDTTKYADGRYALKIVVSDKLSNPSDALKDEVIVEPITIANKPPRVFAFKKTMVVGPDRSVRIGGAAYHDLVGIAGVQYRIDSGDWAAAAASDGLFDTGFETFAITTPAMDKGQHTLEVKAIDQAGNSATVKVPVSIE